MARAFGADVRVLEYAWGAALNALDVEQALRSNPDVRLLLTTHNETSTGVMNDLAQVADVLSAMRGERPLWLVDAVSSLGAVDLPMDAWGCDMVISASQKAWMSPPGLAFVGVSARAWEQVSLARCPRYYWDLTSAREYASKGQTPFTPALSAMYGLCAALRSMSREGLPAIVARHLSLRDQLRAGLRALGLRLFAEDACASPTVTAVWLPSGVSAEEIRLEMARRGVAVAAGMGAFKDQLLRIAHLGHCSPGDIEQVLGALREALACVGAPRGRAL
jgi:aspartate aminotransferase-like enzyme